MSDQTEPVLQRVLDEVKHEVSRSLDGDVENFIGEASDTQLGSKSGSLQGEEEGFSDLRFPGNELKDRVTIMLLFAQAVTAGSINRAWERRKSIEGEKPVLWRILAEDPDLDAGMVYREAALLYSFEEAQVDKLHALSIMREVAGTLDDGVWARMQNLRVIPIDVLSTGEDEARLIFATHDPMRPRVHRLIEELGLEHFDLKYASKQLVDALLAGMNQADPTSLLEPQEVGLQESDEADQEEDGDGAAQEGDVSREALVDLFETALVETVRRGAMSVRFYPNASREVEILLQMDDHVSRWHIEERVPPEVFLTVAKEKIRKRKTFARQSVKDQFISRWIDRKRVRFRVYVQAITNDRRENLLEEIEVHRIIGE